MNNRRCAQCHKPIAEDGDCYCRDCGDEILRELRVHVYYGDGSDSDLPELLDRHADEKYPDLMRQIVLAAYKRMQELEKAKWN